MLKRQRPSSPIPHPMEHTVEADVAPGDLYQPDRKRRRYFTTSHLDKSPWTCTAQEVVNVELEDDIHVPSERREGHCRGTKEWQQQAGEYSAANTLLHDLHAQQRHRQIFAAPPLAHTGHASYTSYYSTQSQSQMNSTSSEGS